MTQRLDDNAYRQLAERLERVRDELEKMARQPPMERNLTRWRELATQEADLLIALRQGRRDDDLA